MASSRLVTRDELLRILAEGADVQLVMTLDEFDYGAMHIPGSIRAQTTSELLELAHDRPLIVYGAHENSAQAIRARRFLECQRVRGRLPIRRRRRRLGRRWAPAREFLAGSGDNYMCHAVNYVV